MRHYEIQKRKAYGLRLRDDEIAILLKEAKKRKITLSELIRNKLFK